MPKIKELLERLKGVEAIACDCILQHALEPGEWGFESIDPHVVVGAYARKLIRGEEISKVEEELAIEAMGDLPRLGSSLEAVRGHSASEDPK